MARLVPEKHKAALGSEYGHHLVSENGLHPTQYEVVFVCAGGQRGFRLETK